MAVLCQIKQLASLTRVHKAPRDKYMAIKSLGDVNMVMLEQSIRWTYSLWKIVGQLAVLLYILHMLTCYEQMNLLTCHCMDIDPSVWCCSCNL